jgi:hypothetical protein
LLGQHLKWDDPPRSEFLSFSISLLFLFVHALGRHEKGQRPVYVAWGPSSCYPATVLHKVYRLLKRKWNGQEFKLDPRKFTHEYLFHGILEDLNDDVQHVLLWKLVENGLLYRYPQLQVRDLCERTGLYEFLTAYRVGMFYNATGSEITEKDLKICEGLANLFRKPNETKTPLYLFLGLLGLKRRKEKNETFRAWIKSNYSSIFPFHATFHDSS